MPVLPFLSTVVSGPALRLAARLTRLAKRDGYVSPAVVERFAVVDHAADRMTVAIVGYSETVRWRRIEGPVL